MGNKSNTPVSVKDRDEKPSQANSVILAKSSFDYLYVIGRGGFGKVKDS